MEEMGGLSLMRGVPSRVEGLELERVYREVV